MQHTPFTTGGAHLKASHTLKLAVLGASLCWLAPVLGDGAQAHAASASSAAERSYKIAPGALGTVLNRFATEAGVVLSFDTGLTQGKQSPGLNGRFAVEQGFAALLAGAGLHAVAGADGSYVLEPAPEGNGVQLGATNIDGNKLGATTENSGSYTTGSTSTATRLALSQRETPQSVTVITRQQIDDQGMNNLNDLVEKTPGLTVQRSGIERPTYYARGFTISNILYDGLPTTISSVFTRDSIPPPDLTIYDRVEVVKGATGLTQGSGNPAAAINLVRKRPTHDTQMSITGSAGTWDNYRTEFDASGALNDAGTVRGRTVAAYQSKNSFQDVVDNERSTFYAIGEMDLDEATIFTLGASNQNDNKTTAWGGVPMAANGDDLHLSRSTFLGNDWGRWDQDNTSVFADIEHRFANDWRLRLAATKTWSEADIFASYAAAATVGWNQISGKFNYKNEQQSYDLYATGPFQLLGREHQLVAGLNHRKDHFEGWGNSGTTATNMNIYNWNPGVTPRPAYDLSGWGMISDSEENGVYLTSRFSLTDTLKLIVGGRLDWYESENTTYYYGAADPETRDKVPRHLTRYAGLIYDLGEHHSLYASFTDIYQPQGVLDISGDPIKPMLGKNIEVGIKGEYFDGALNASAALFRVDQENRATQIADQTQCPNYDLFQTCYEVAGKVRSEGLELEVNGALTPAWQLAAGYTYISSKYKQDANPANVGTLYDTDLPRHLFKLSTTYQLPGAFERWRVGGNLYRQNDIYNKGSNYRIEQDAYTLVGLMVGYQPSQHLDVRLNVNNLFDTRYYHTLDTSPYTSYNIYGDPRNATVTLKWSL